jgi:Leucine-rich repeat (LRR) protein
MAIQPLPSTSQSAASTANTSASTAVVENVAQQAAKVTQAVSDEKKMAPTSATLDPNRISIITADTQQVQEAVNQAPEVVKQVNQELQAKNDNALQVLWSLGIQIAIKNAMMEEITTAFQEDSNSIDTNTLRIHLELVSHFKPLLADDIRKFLKKPEIAAWVPKITSLQAMGANICVIPKEIQLFSNLKHLHLGSNQISSISADDFKGLAQLELLNLSGNQLSSIPSDLLTHLPNLLLLNMCNNQITELPEDFLSSSGATLHAVDLSHNPLQKPSSLGPFQETVSFGSLNFINMQSPIAQTIDE